jgi:hypothetical protein
MHLDCEVIVLMLVNVCWLWFYRKAGIVSSCLATWRRGSVAHAVDHSIVILGGPPAPSTLARSRTKQGSSTNHHSTILHGFFVNTDSIIHQGCEAIPGLGIRPTQVSYLLVPYVFQSNQAHTHKDMITVQVPILRMLPNLPVTHVFTVPFDKIIKEGIIGSKCSTRMPVCCTFIYPC